MKQIICAYYKSCHFSPCYLKKNPPVSLQMMILFQLLTFLSIRDAIYITFDELMCSNVGNLKTFLHDNMSMLLLGGWMAMWGNTSVFICSTLYLKIFLWNGNIWSINLMFEIDSNSICVSGMCDKFYLHTKWKFCVLDILKIRINWMNQELA